MMLKIYEIDEARRTILNRLPLSFTTYPDRFLRGVESLFGVGVTPPQAVTKILDTVRQDGDKALGYWTEKLDRVTLSSFLIPEDELESAWKSLSEDLREALTIAKTRIRDFHRRQPLPDWTTSEMGGVLGQRVTPVARAGVYVPGGTAPLPSSLLMSVIPAQVAGVADIIVCTPPNVSASILGAAYLCGIEKIFTLGGAQAIAAMAFGTESVPRVDKIVGAGNLFVTLAKQKVYGSVGLDGLAGPTETLVVADETARPAWVAADLLAQAEHDVLASAILLTTSRSLAQAVQNEVAQQMESLSRNEIIAASLVNRSGIVITPDLETACQLASDYGAEHTCLAVREPMNWAEKISNAGGLFIGEGSFEVLGDYVAGPSHVMPTGGTARFASPLTVMDFVKITSIIALDDTTSKDLSTYAARIAHEERLTAHARAAEIRMEAVE